MADDILKLILFDEYVRILIKISLKCVPKGSIYNKPVHHQAITWTNGDQVLLFLMANRHGITRVL